MSVIGRLFYNLWKNKAMINFILLSKFFLNSSDYDLSRIFFRKQMTNGKKTVQFIVQFSTEYMLYHLAN